jgi:phage-related minor tail protein
MMVQYWIVQPLFNAIGGALGMPTTAATGKAIGGSVQNGQPYMVGERGPEMFVPNQSGSIVPNGSLGGGGGVTVNQTINVSTGVQQTVRAEIATLMPQIANAAKGAVADARQRGGGFSKSLVGA